jgi:hypothetical protein
MGHAHCTLHGTIFYCGLVWAQADRQLVAGFGIGGSPLFIVTWLAASLDWGKMGLVEILGMGYTIYSRVSSGEDWRGGGVLG